MTSQEAAGFVGHRSSRLMVLLSLAAVFSLLVGGMAATSATAAGYPELPAKVVEAVTKAGGVCQGGTCKPADGRSSVTLDGNAVGVNLLKGTDFGGWQIEGFNFQNLDMSNTRWDRARLERVNWKANKGKGTSFRHAQMIDVNVSNSEFVEGNFIGAKGTGIAMSHVRLAGCDMHTAELDGSRRSGQSNHEWVGVSFLENTHVGELKITNVSMFGVEAKKVTGASTLTVSNSNLRAEDVSVLAKAGVKEFPANQITGTLGSKDGTAVLERVNLAGSSFSNFTWLNLVFKECNLNAISVNADHVARIDNVKLVNGSIDHGNLSGVDAKEFEIRMESGRTIKGFAMVGAKVVDGVMGGKFTDTDLSYTAWTRSDLKNLRGDPERELKPGEFHVYLGGGSAHESTAPQESRKFDYESFELTGNSKIPDNARVVDSRLNRMTIDKSTTVGRNYEIRNSLANNLKASGNQFVNLKVVESDVAGANFDGSTFSGDTKFDSSVVEDATFRDISLKGQLFRFTGWIRNILIRFGLLSPSSSMSFNGAAIQGEIDFTGSRTDGEYPINWRGAIAEPGAKIVLNSRVEAQNVSAEMDRAGVAMDRVQIDYKTRTGQEVLKPATAGGNAFDSRLQRIHERSNLSKSMEAFYKKAEIERRAEQAKIRQELQQKFPKPKLK